MSQLILPFSGSEVRAIDGKGRLAFPSRYRERLGSPFILTRASGGVIVALPDRTWLSMLKANEDDVAFLGFYLSGAELVSPQESTGRVQLGYSLREWADLPLCGDAVVAGAGKGLVIASPDRWASHLSRWEAELAARKAAQRGVVQR